MTDWSPAVIVTGIVAARPRWHRIGLPLRQRSRDVVGCVYVDCRDYNAVSVLRQCSRDVVGCVPVGGWRYIRNR